ncbi:hypothetical protein [Jannaschia sp. R86511]|uniref:hypothetical protein n=1 Tax=Jannaschia sp. R86511 TaxID=3093853 RepID=UPI0036D2B4AD
MTWNTRAVLPATVLGVAALALSACGGDPTTEGVEAVEVGTEATEPAPDAVEDTGSPTTSDTSATGTGTGTGTGTDDTAAPAPSAGAGATGDATAAPGAPARPAADECVDLPEAADGVYTVYEAGTATVTREGDRLVLGDVVAADGWTPRVDTEDADEVEVDFRRDDRTVLDLEVEIDDGRVEVQVCADDD